MENIKQEKALSYFRIYLNLINVGDTGTYLAEKRFRRFSYNHNINFKLKIKS